VLAKVKICTDSGLFPVVEDSEELIFMALITVSPTPMVTESSFMCMEIREGDIFTNCLEQQNSYEKCAFVANYKLMFRG